MGGTNLKITTALMFLTLFCVPLALSAILVPLSKPDCEEKCGNMSVPFPFGIGDSNCFLDEWYELVCNKSVTPHKLFHKRMQLEVLSITMDNNEDQNRSFPYQQVQVRAPVSFFNCPGNTTRKRVDLTEAPFSFSSSNVFVAVSCGVRAQLNSSSGNIFSKIGCNSLCSLNNTTATTNQDGVSCDGVGCCQTSITSILDSFQISFDNSTSSFAERQIGDQCKFAFVVDREYWRRYQNERSSFAEIRDMGYIPLMLDWNLANYSFLDIFNSSMALYKRSESLYCSGFSDIYPSPYRLDCNCRYGFRGNPYLLDGCSQDINECEELYNPCSKSGSSCVNTKRGYHCSFKNKLLLIGFGSAFGALFLLICIWVLFKKIKKSREFKRKRKFFKRNGGLLLQQQLSPGEGNNIEKTKLFDSDELDKATVHFSVDRILGQGGQGTVYKGMLDDGKIVAVKKSKIVGEDRISEFINEVVILSQINHRNVVQLLGCCLETEVPILVYEFIPNGTLCQYVNDRNDDFPFTWKMRLRVAAEVAGALSYLHSAASFPIYHRDIKSSNILLDEKYTAKVADFGTSRTIALEQTHLTTLVYGTFGYLDPEYFQSSQFTDKSDVYSFGVVLVELLTGQKAICAMRAEEGRNLATYFTMSMEENGLFDIVDRQVLEEGTKEEILVVACLALRCLNLSGRNRPTMKEVAMELEALRKSEREGASTNPQQNYDEVEFNRAEVAEPWEDITMSTIPFETATSGSSLQQELPLLSFGSK